MQLYSPEGLISNAKRLITEEYVVIADTLDHI